MWCFGDSFDLYAAMADAVAGYWDSGTATGTLAAGRFAGGRCYQNGTAIQTVAVKSSGANDAVHHITVAFKQDAALTGSTLGLYLQLLDGATGQCCIIFRSDGAIVLTSGTTGGAVLATYTGAVTILSQWFAFEIEVVINSTTGSFRVRTNNATSDSFVATGLNTRVSANNYANSLAIKTASSVNNQYLDDLLWRSDPASVPWVGDIRAYVRMPASDVSKQFSLVGSASQTFPTSVTTATVANSATTARYTQISPNYTGSLSSVSVSSSTAGGNVKCCVFADNAGAPGAIIQSGGSQPNGGGTIVFSFSGVSLSKGVPYWFGFMWDTASLTLSTATSATAQGATGTSTYAAFPQANPVVTTPGSGFQTQIAFTPTANWGAVADVTQDGATSYVYDSNVGDADFYSIASIPVTPAAVVAVTTRGFAQKSDAGSRTGAMQIKSGATTVQSVTGSTLQTTFAWMWRTDMTDPATGAAWTPTGVNNLQIGPTVLT